jgi:hypothetical protein
LAKKKEQLFGPEFCEALAQSMEQVDINPAPQR